MKFYDKIFFLVSLLGLGVSSAYYFMNEPELQKTANKVASLLSQEAEGVQWKEVSVPKMEIKPIEWPEVKAQDPEGRWFFQVFTAPQIWVDSDGKFITESPYIKEKARQSFALRYAGVSNEPYPVKYLGFMGSPESPRIQLRNEADNTFMMGKINEPIKVSVKDERGLAKEVEVGLTIKKFDRKRVKKADNTIGESVTVVVFDKKYGKEISIYSDKPTVIEDSRRIELVLPDGKKWFVREVGESQTVADATYTVKSLNFDDGNVVVEMVPSNKEISPQTMKLSEKGVEPYKTPKN